MKNLTKFIEEGAEILEAKNVDESFGKMMQSLKTYFQTTVSTGIEKNLFEAGIDVDVRLSSVDDRLVEYWVQDESGKGILSFEVYIIYQKTPNPVLILHLLNPQWRPKTSGQRLDDAMKEITKRSKSGGPVLVLNVQAAKSIEVLK